MRHSLPASSVQFPVTANYSNKDNPNLDRLYQRIVAFQSCRLQARRLSFATRTKSS
jgi:hypothetical protein